MAKIREMTPKCVKHLDRGANSGDYELHEFEGEDYLLFIPSFGNTKADVAVLRPSTARNFCRRDELWMPDEDEWISNRPMNTLEPKDAEAAMSLLRRARQIRRR